MLFYFIFYCGYSKPHYLCRILASIDYYFISVIRNLVILRGHLAIFSFIFYHGRLDHVIVLDFFFLVNIFFGLIVLVRDHVSFHENLVNVDFNFKFVGIFL